MKQLKKIVCLAALSGIPLVAGAADLSIQVAGQAKGRIYAALYDSEEAWKAMQQPLRGEYGTYADGYSLVFKGLPPGRYALSVFIDENDNKTLDRNPIGVPVEPYGISRNAVGRMGPPTFSDAAIELSENASTIINLR
ncbi:MAG: DUF2141 domain-containing protein [Burkholderiales bacterium]|nr:DUF2141 domain-containing protein [Burkholderiales bacterium]